MRCAGMARTKQFIDNLCWRLKALCAPKVHLLCLGMSFQSGYLPSILGSRRNPCPAELVAGAGICNIVASVDGYSIAALAGDNVLYFYRNAVLNMHGNSKCPNHMIYTIVRSQPSSFALWNYLLVKLNAPECSAMQTYLQHDLTCCI